MDKRISTTFVTESQAINDEVVEFFRLVNQQVELLLESLERDASDRDALESDYAAIKDIEQQTNQIEISIFDLCHIFLMRFSPLAEDLRRTLATVNLSAALESMADEIAHVSKYYNQAVSDSGNIDLAFQKRISQVLIEALTKGQKSLKAIQSMSVKGIDDRVAKVDAREQQINTMTRAVTDEIYQEVAGEASGSLSLGWCLHMILVARAVERFGDHVQSSVELLKSVEGQQD